MRAKILDAAKQILVDVGLEGLSIRGIASRVGISAMTVYLYYDSRQDIVTALIRHGLAILKQRLDAANKGSDARQRLSALGDAYVAFACEHPEYYRALFSSVPEAERNLGGFQTLTADVQQALLPVLQAVAEIVGGRPELTIERALVMWCALHGFTSLSLNDRFRLLGFDAEQLQAALRSLAPRMLEP
jgi:AcrR family transcriptional regulator